MPHYSQTLGERAAGWWGYWNFPTDGEELKIWSNMCGNDVRPSLVAGWIALVFTNYAPTRFRGAAGWLILATIYVNRIAFPIGTMSRFVHGLDLMILGLVSHQCGLQYKDKIGEWIMRYWFIVIFLCTWLRLTDVHGRLDVNPPNELISRARVNLVELIVLAVWLTTAERLFFKAAFSAETLKWLKLWALLLYLGHQAVHIVAPKPWNWLVLAASLPLVYLLRSCQDRSSFAYLMATSTYDNNNPDEAVAILGQSFTRSRGGRQHSSCEGPSLLGGSPPVC
jgi:hypothetical protein